MKLIEAITIVLCFTAALLSFILLNHNVLIMQDDTRIETRLGQEDEHKLQIKFKNPKHTLDASGEEHSALTIHRNATDQLNTRPDYRLDLVKVGGKEVKLSEIKSYRPSGEFLFVLVTVFFAMPIAIFSLGVLLVTERRPKIMYVLPVIITIVFIVSLLWYQSIKILQ